MAAERIVIIVSSQGADKAAKDVAGVGAAAATSASSVDLLKASLALLGITSATVLATKLADLADAYTTMTNRLEFVTHSHDRAVIAMQQLSDVANRSRQDLEGTVELYSRTALATQKLGLSQKDLLDITETLNKASHLSGATFREAHLALIQLSQGLASGTLRGDELRSVLEQLPLVGKLIADSMGVDVGALRALASQGKITSDVVVKAVLSQKDAIDEAFGKTTPTITQSLAKFNNELLLFVGRVNESTAASKIIGTALQFIAENIDVLAVAMGLLALTAIPRMLTALNTLTVALSVNPYVLLAAAIATLGYVIAREFIPSMQGATAESQNWENAGDKLITTWSKTELEINQVTDRLNDERNALVLNAEQREYLHRLLKEEQKLREKGLSLDDRQRGILENSIREVEDAKRRVQLFNQVFGSTNKSAADLKGFAQLFNEGSINITQFTEAMYHTLPAFGQVIKKLEDTAKVRSQITRIVTADQVVSEQNAISRLQTGKDLTDEEQNSLITLLDKLEVRKQEIAILDRLNGADDAYLVDLTAIDNLLARGRISQEEYNAQLIAMKLRLSDLKDPMGKLIADLQKQQHFASLPTSRQEKIERTVDSTHEQFKRSGDEANFNEQLLRSQLNLNDALEAKQKIIREQNDIMDDFATKEQAYLEIIQQGGSDVDIYVNKLRDLRIEQEHMSTDVASGFRAGFLQIGKDLNDWASLSEKVVTDTFQGMEDGLVKFVQTGKFSFADLVNTILADLTRLVARQAISGLLGAFGGSGGFIGTLLGGIGTPKAAGGPVTAGTSYKVGERGPETFVPQNSGVILPTGAQGSSSGPAMVTVVNAIGEDAIADAIESSKRAGEVIVNKIRLNKSATKQALGS